MSIIAMPWSFKLLYGIASDTVPIFGYRRKSYLIMNGIIATLIMYMIIMPGLVVNKYFLTALVFIQ